MGLETGRKQVDSPEEAAQSLVLSYQFVCGAALAFATTLEILPRNSAPDPLMATQQTNDRYHVYRRLLNFLLAD